MSQEKRERTIEEAWTERNSLCRYYDFCLDAAARRNLLSPGCSLCPNRDDKSGPGLGPADIQGCLVLLMMIFEKESPFIAKLAAQWREEKRLDELESLLERGRKRHDERLAPQDSPDPCPAAATLGRKRHNERLAPQGRNPEGPEELEGSEGVEGPEGLDDLEGLAEPAGPDAWGGPKGSGGSGGSCGSGCEDDPNDPNELNNPDGYFGLQVFSAKGRSLLAGLKSHLDSNSL